MTQCPVNAYQNRVDNNNADSSLYCERCPDNCYASVGAISINDCSQCPYHRKLKSKDSSCCSIN